MGAVEYFPNTFAIRSLILKSSKWQIVGKGFPSTTYRFQASTNLKNWFTVETNVTSNDGSFKSVDVTDTNSAFEILSNFCSLIEPQPTHRGREMPPAQLWTSVDHRTHGNHPLQVFCGLDDLRSTWSLSEQRFAGQNPLQGWQNLFCSFSAVSVIMAHQPKSLF